MDNLRNISPQTGTNREKDGAAERQDEFLGHYRLERELGRGFSSIVYEATDERRQRRTALKVLTFLQTLNEDRRRDMAERFRREAQAVSALSHPNIVAIYEVGHADDGRQFIAMECLPGETLRHCLHRASPLSAPEAAAIAIRVAEALHYAHSRGIIHRDIKPDNIFLAESVPGEPVPKLMDFGIAHVLSEEGLTQDGTIVGSPAYMSPEQINGLPLDARTDLFSLAVTLAEMVAGVKPFEGETIPAVMQKILHSAPNLRAVPDGRLRRVLAKALSKNPAARYLDAAAFAEALRRAAPLAAAAPSVATQLMSEMPRQPTATFSRRRRSGLAAVGLGALAVAALAVWPLLSKQPPKQPQTAERPVERQFVLGEQRREIAAVWHPAKLSQPHSTPRSGSSNRIRIAEVESFSPSLSYYAHPARISSVTQPPKPPTAPFVPIKPARPNQPMRPKLPHPAASPRPVPARLALSAPAPPIVRVMAARQALTPETLPEIDEPKPPAETPLPPPRTQLPADAPPHAVHCPLPSTLAPLDSPTATVRVQLTIDENGDVTEATILTSSDSRELDDATLDAVGQWKYKPAIQDGRRVPGSVIETIQFSRR